MKIRLLFIVTIISLGWCIPTFGQFGTSCPDSVYAASLWASSGNAALAYDGNNESRWESAFTDLEWLAFEFDTTYTISEMIIRWETASSKDYYVQGSNDTSSSWVTIKSLTNMAAEANRIDTVSGLFGRWRYLRIYGTSRTTPYGHSIFEVRFCGEVQGADAANDPMISTTATPTSGFTPLQVNFNATGTTDPNGNPLTYFWDFNDGNLGVGLTASNTYNNAGDYQAHLVVTDGNGGFAEDDFTISVTEPSYPPVENCNQTIITSAWASTEVNAGSVAENAIDGGDTAGGSRWESIAQVDPQWLALEFDQPYIINGVIIHWEAASAQTYQIQGSNDTSGSWINLKSVTSVSAVNHTDSVYNLNADSTAYKFLRVYGTTRNLTYGYSIFEIEVCASALHYWNGTTWNSDPDTATSVGVESSISIASGGNPEISSDINISRLSVQPGATLNITNGNTVTVSDTAILHADATGYSQVIGAISGISKVESYRTGTSAKWMNVSFPVDATLASITGVPINATGNASSCNIYRFDATVDGTDGPANNEGDWVMVSSLTDQTENIAYTVYLDNGAFFGTFPATMSSVGTLLNGNQNVAVSDAQTNAWNYIPNPYPSTVEWNLFTADADNSELLNTTYYIQDGNPDTASIIYRSYNGTAGVNGGSNDIPPGQSFFVEVGATGNLTFKNSHRNLTGTTGLYKGGAAAYPHLKLKTSFAQGAYSDETVIGFDGSFGPALDHNFDGAKRRNAIYPNLFTKLSTGEEMTFNGLSDGFATVHLEPLHFAGDIDGNYSIEISKDELPLNWEVKLEDKLNGNLVLLRDTSYSFMHANGNQEDRFILHIIKSSSVGLSDKVAEIYTYTSKNQLYINLDKVNGPVEMKLIDVNGRLLKKENLNGGQLVKTDLSAYANGMYLLSLKQGEEEIYSEKIVK